MSDDTKKYLCEVMWLDVGNIEALASKETRPEVAEWLRDLAQRMREAMHPPARARPTQEG